jgi:predicted nucleic acid-binding protein
MKVFVDSNIPMYVAGRDHPHREPARRFLERVRAGDVEACTSTEVLQEILYRYAGLRRLDLAGQVYDLFVQLCPVIFAVTLADTDRAKSMLADTAGIGVRDAIHAAVMANNDVTAIATFDTAFDHVPGVSRVSLDVPL